MKKLLATVAVILAFVGAAYSATQYQRIGNVDLSSSTARGGFLPWPRTIAQLKALTSTTTGQMVYCSDCVAGGRTGALVVSSGTMATDQFTLSTGTKCW